MSDITSKTLTIGSGTSKVIFNSNNSVIMPKGDDSEEAVQVLFDLIQQSNLKVIVEMVGNHKGS